MSYSPSLTLKSVGFSYTVKSVVCFIALLLREISEVITSVVINS